MAYQDARLDDWGIHRVRFPLGERFVDMWLYPSPDGHLLFDTGVAGTLSSVVAPYLADRGLDVGDINRVVVSHMDIDHCGDVGSVTAVLPEADVIAHEGDVLAIEDWSTFVTQRGDSFAEGWGLPESQAAMDWMNDVFKPGPVDVVLQGDLPVPGSRNLEIWHVPGHSHGHLAIMDMDNSVLAISDAILGAFVPLATGQPAFPPTYRYVDDYLATIERVRTAAPKVLLTAHYGDYTGDGIADFLDQSVQFVESVEQNTLDAIDAGNETIVEIVDFVNPRIATWPLEGMRTALAFPVAGHIERAHARGDIRREEGPEGWRWVR
jgi:glyoxylase-like metal-dependent hydrolase (beta-lactamase superfamily II)